MKKTFISFLTVFGIVLSILGGFALGPEEAEASESPGVSRIADLGLTDTVRFATYEESCESSAVGAKKVEYSLAYAYNVICADDGYDELSEHVTEPYVTKIMSKTQLVECWKSDSPSGPGYTDNFFYDNFIIALSWDEPYMTSSASSGLTVNDVYTVYSDGESLNIVWLNKSEQYQSGSQVRKYTALIECPKKYSELPCEVLVRDKKVPLLEVGDVSCSAGDTIEIPVSLSECSENISEVAAMLIYDSTLLTPVSVTAGNKMPDGSVIENDMGEPGRITIDCGLSQPPNGSGELFVISFKVSENIDDVVTDLSFDYGALGCADGECLELIPLGGMVEIDGNTVHEPEYWYDIEDGRNSYAYIRCLRQADNAVLICASYDKNGALINIDTVPLSMKTGEYAGVAMETMGTRYNMFIWDNETMRPYSKVYKYSQTGVIEQPLPSV